MDPRKRFGLRLKEARERKGMSQTELASLIGEGVRQSHVSKYEAGDAMPRPDRIILLSQILDVSEGWLRGLYPDDEKEENLDFSGDQTPTERAPTKEELIWRKRELEQKRENLELKERLMAQESLFGHLAQLLDRHLFCLDLLLEKLETEEKERFEALKESLVEDVHQAAAFDSGAGSGKLRASLRELESFFQTKRPEFQPR